MNITMTPAAIAHFKQIMLRHEKSIGFRLTMRKYGCNGYAYVPDVIETAPLDDIELIVCSEFRFFADVKYAEVLDGTEIDFITKGLGQKQLIFRNPNVAGECGCGESVNFKGK